MHHDVDDASWSFKSRPAFPVTTVSELTLSWTCNNIIHALKLLVGCKVISSGCLIHSGFGKGGYLAWYPYMLSLSRHRDNILRFKSHKDLCVCSYFSVVRTLCLSITMRSTILYTIKVHVSLVKSVMHSPFIAQQSDFKLQRQYG